MTVPTALVEKALAGAAGQRAGIATRIERRVRLAGGDISAVERLHTNHGTYILKSLPRDLPGLLRAEADGLEALRGSGTPLAVPSVIACVEGPNAFLILEDLGSGPAGTHLDERIGFGLAALHRCGAPRFGFPRDNFCGATSQPNTWTDSWTDFYGRQRLGHQMTLASRARLLSASDTSVIEQLISRLDTLLQEPEEGTALIHGDLWSGNLHVTAAGDPALIDPAVYYAHREAELGMMQLFGGFPSRVYDAYHEAFPLEPGWQDRSDIYQLYHLLNHLNLFGRSYYARVMAVARRYI